MKDCLIPQTAHFSSRDQLFKQIGPDLRVGLKMLFTICRLIGSGAPQ